MSQPPAPFVPSAQPPPWGPPPPPYPGRPSAPPPYPGPWLPAYPSAYIPPSPQYRPDLQPLADFGHRFLARLIDSVILGAVGVALGAAAFALYLALARAAAPLGTHPQTDTFAHTAYIAVVALWLVLFLAASYLYEVELMYRWGQTIGKRAMGIKIVPVAPVTRLTRGSAAVRWLIQDAATSFVPYLGPLDGLWQLWDRPWRQCLHDKAARTVVVKLTR